LDPPCWARHDDVKGNHTSRDSLLARNTTPSFARQAYLVNAHYAAYSRAVGRNFVNLFFPNANETPDVASYSYRIYTINDTISDARKLLDTYFAVRAWGCGGATQSHEWAPYLTLPSQRWAWACVSVADVDLAVCVMLAAAQHLGGRGGGGDTGGRR
jgi:hypothetical protein